MKMIDDVNKKIAEFKEVFEVLPDNNKANKKRKLSCLEEEEKVNNEQINLIKSEIENRINSFSNLKENEEISKLKAELEKCNIVNEWNNYNTSYEKMHLDYYLYQLHRYYKEDLDSVNECIRKIISSFNKVDINLTKEDFGFNNYAQEYMDKIINKASNEELASIFENLYWKNPDILKTIEINIKSIYLKYEKKINRYYEIRHEEFLKNHQDSEIYDMRKKIYYKILELESRDKLLNFNKFVNNEYRLSDFKDIDRLKERYFSEDSYNYDKLLELLNILYEYKILIDYKYLFDDMKEKLEKKDGLKNSKSTILKKVNTDISKIEKLNSKKNKKPLFGKVKKDEKWLFDYKNILNEIINNYNEFDNACFEDLIYSKLSKDSSIIEVLELICSNYLYFVNKKYEQDENLDINLINSEHESLKSFIMNNNLYLLNNVALLDERQMKELIVNKYQLENIKLTIDSLLEDNLQNTIDDIKSLINYENITFSGLNLEDISLYLEYKKINS